MSRLVSQDPKDWTEEDVLYLFQYDQRAEEVKARAEELGVPLPQPTPLGAPSRPEGGLSDYSLEALFAHMADRQRMDPDAFATASEAYQARQDELAAETVTVSEYDDMTKDDLRAEITLRQLPEPSSNATKAELVQVLVDDDNK